MLKIRQHRLIAAILLMVILFSALFNVPAALADGETPTEPAVATEVSAEPTALPEESSTTPEAGQSATPEPPASPEPVAPQSTPTAAILADVPADTSVVVLDGQGSPLVLGTQETAEAVVKSDPVWCPEGQFPGGLGCSANFASITDLLTAMRTNPGAFASNGTIFLEHSGNTTFTTPLILDDSAGSLSSAFATLSSFNLSVRGGYNGGTGSGSVGGTQALFNNEGYILIGSLANPWVGNIRLEDIEVRDASLATSITVYTSSGDITFDDVDVAEQTGDKYLVYLHSLSGDINIGNGSNFHGNDADLGNNQSRGFYAQTGGSITVDGTDNSQYSFRDNEGTPAGEHNGATLIAPTVTLTNVISRANDGNGIYIQGASLVTLTNVTSSVNQSGSTGNGLSGILIQGTGSTIVNLHGGTFAKNGRYGIELFGGTLIVYSDPTCPTDGATANGLGCFNVTPTTPGADNTPPVITPSVSGPPGSNGWYVGNVTVNWMVSDAESPVSSTSGCGSFVVSADTAGTTFTCSATSSGGTNSQSVTVKRDAIAPSLNLPANMSVANGPVAVSYFVSANDAMDPSPSVNCSPASGSVFPVGTSTVSCTATDEAGHSTPGSFLVTVSASSTPVTPTSPAPTSPVPTSTAPPASGSGSSGSGSSGPQSFESFLVPLRSGQPVDIDCDSVYLAFGVRLSFIELCDYQAMATEVSEDGLPASLPEDSSFVLGLDLSILDEGQALKTLPVGAGVQLDFPVAAGEYTVLFWDEAAGEWVEVSSPLATGELAEALEGDGLFKLTPSLADFLQILTTDKTGIFILVQK